jgi:WXG100 family type VII secretion target
MNDIRVTHAALDAGAQDISSAGARIRGLLDDLHSNTADLRQRFDGEARAAWDEAKRHWDLNMEDVDSILALIESLVLRTRGNFADADRISAGNNGGNV